MNNTKFETIKTVRNGHEVIFEPIIKKCTYYHPDNQKNCKNCNGSRRYVDGYYMIYEVNGKKCGFIVDTLK